MNRYQRSVLACAFALALMVGSVIGAGSPRAFLPVIVTAQPAVHDALIYSCQCGAVTASPMPDGRVLLTIQDHSRGGVMVVGIDDGMTFTELGTTSAYLAPAAPTFQFPGEKQGVGSSLYVWGHIVTWAPNRTEEGGRYNIWRDVYEGP